jgi:uncharacterized membrane protein
MPRRERPSAIIEESIVIERSLADVFAFYRDFRHLPDFLGDVVRVEVTAGDPTSRWTIRAPLGFAVHWTVVVTDLRPNTFIAYQTAWAGAPARWEVSFSSGAEPGTTVVHEVMSMPGGLIAAAVLAAIGKPPASEVRANLKRLKELLETGYVTTMDYAVPGKFAPRSGAASRRQ